jgi:alkyldihydroxyacetonephosphate synthase
VNIRRYKHWGWGSEDQQPTLEAMPQTASIAAAPHVRDVLVAMGMLAETFETAITWDRFAAFHERVKASGEEAPREVCGEGGRVTACFTHVYPGGPAVYFTAIAPARRGEEGAQWAAVKRAVSDAILAGGGTITRHHAVGRDHRPCYDRQRPDTFALALAGAKAAVGPRSVMNPGVLVDPRMPVDLGAPIAPAAA